MSDLTILLVAAASLFGGIKAYDVWKRRQRSNQIRDYVKQLKTRKEYPWQPDDLPR